MFPAIAPRGASIHDELDTIGEEAAYHNYDDRVVSKYLKIHECYAELSERPEYLLVAVEILHIDQNDMVRFEIDS